MCVGIILCMLECCIRECLLRVYASYNICDDVIVPAGDVQLCGVNG